MEETKSIVGEIQELTLLLPNGNQTRYSVCNLDGKANCRKIEYVLGEGYELLGFKIKVEPDNNWNSYNVVIKTETFITISNLIGWTLQTHEPK